MMRVLMGAFAIAFTQAAGVPEGSSCSEDTNFLQLGVDATAAKESAMEKAAANRHSSLKAAMKTQTGCQTAPSFSGVACPEGKVCTYKETNRGETFTAETSGSFTKVTLQGHSLYVSEEWLIADSPCDGKTLKANILEPALLEGHSMTCTDKVLTDVGPDAVNSIVRRGDHGLDFVGVGGDGTVFLDHFDFSSSAPGEGFIVPSGSMTEVTRGELFEQFSGDCASPALVDALDRAVSKKGIATMIFGGLLIAGGVAICVGCPPCCYAGIALGGFGAHVLNAGIWQEVRYRQR